MWRHRLSLIRMRLTDQRYRVQAIWCMEEEGEMVSWSPSEMRNYWFFEQP
jgi:hypothetical protein